MARISFAFENENLYLIGPIQGSAFLRPGGIVDSPAAVNTQIGTGNICLALIVKYLRMPADPDAICHDLGLLAGITTSQGIIAPPNASSSQRVGSRLRHGASIWFIGKAIAPEDTI